MLFGAALALACVIPGISALIGKRSKRATHHLPYECGIDPVVENRRRIPVHFFLVAVQFIIFDIEVVFLYPWAMVFKQFVEAGFGLMMFVKMMIFLGVLVIGFVYVWRRGALEWED